MESSTLRYIFHFIVLLAAQILIFEFVNEHFPYVSFFPYLFVLLLIPIEVSAWLLFLFALITGLVVDVYYNSLGLHASACLTMVFFRKRMLNYMAPREGYELNAKADPKDQKWSWFITYLLIMLSIHHVWLFYMEFFSFTWFFHVLLKVFNSVILNTVLLSLLYLLLIPKKK